jgi:hypothetical protein
VGLGSTRETVRQDGTVVGRYYRYYAYGETKSEQVSMNQAYKYTGKPLDTEKGLGGRERVGKMGLFLRFLKCAVSLGQSKRPTV